jgi:hypothetical protein
MRLPPAFAARVGAVALGVPGKAWQVLGAMEGRDRLRVFRADMGEDGSFDDAVRGCVALFHVAASMDIHVPQEGQDNVGELLRRTRPVLNPMCVCLSVCTWGRLARRTGEGSSEELGKTLTSYCPCCCRGAREVECAGAGDEGNNQRAAVLRPRGDRPPSRLHVLHQHDDGGRAAAEEGGRRRVVRQSARRRLAHHARRLGACLHHLTSLHTTHPKRANNLDDQVYILSKRLTEETAFEFAREKGLHLVSLVIPTVAGPFLTPNVPTSVQLLMSPVTGDSPCHAVERALFPTIL